MTELPNRQVVSYNDDNITNNHNGTCDLHYICTSCGSSVRHTVPTESLYMWIVLRRPIQISFKDTDEKIREAIMLHTCVECSERIWANLSEED